eukprot:1866575-Prymnesium_polylepis.1
MAALTNRGRRRRRRRRDCGGATLRRGGATAGEGGREVLRHADKPSRDRRVADDARGQRRQLRPNRHRTGLPGCRPARRHARGRALLPAVRFPINAAGATCAVQRV